MSYFVDTKRATKAEVEIAIRDELAKIPNSQPVHETDIDQAFEATKAFLALMSDDPTRDIYVSVSGSIWKPDKVEQVSLNISISFLARE